MLFLVLAVMTGLIAAFYNYSTSARLQLSNEDLRSREKITVTKYGVDQNVLSVTIINTGTTEVTIRALYKVLDGQVTYYFDPSTNMDTHIKVGGSLTLSFPNGVTLLSNEKVIAATERGTRSLDYYTPPPTPTPLPPTGDSKYTYGDIELEWTEFKYATWNGNNFDSNGPWADAWSIQNPKANVAWKVTIKNINENHLDIILTSNSGLNVDPTGTGSGAQPSKRTWFLYSEPTNKPQTVTLPWNQEISVIFAWSSYDANNPSYQGIYSQPCVCVAFLTFFGHYSDNSPYGQTIPFEAAIKVG